MRICSHPACRGGCRALAANDTDAAEAQREIRDLEALIDRARVAGDVATFEGVLADDFVTTSPTGARSDRQALLDDARAGTMSVSRSHSSEIEVVVHGDVAVVRGIAELDAKYDGHDISGRYAYTHVYKRRGGSWQVTAAQSTREIPDWAFIVLVRLTRLAALRRRR